MTKLEKYQKSAVAILTVGMVMLVLLSSCDLRKSFTSYFDLPFVKALNVSKTTISSSHCDLSTQSQDEVTVQSPKTFSPFAIPVERVSSLFSHLSVKNIPLFSPPDESTQQIPIYILFKRLKVYA
ncbi:hypothetical protein [Halocola ammonii]